MEKNEVKQAVAELMKDGTKRGALAEMLVEYVDPQHITHDWIGDILTTRTLAEGDALVKKVRKGIRVHSFVPGQIPLRSEITIDERMNHILDAAIVSVGASEWELQSGELGTVDSIAREMGMKLKDYYANKLFTALTTIWTAANTPNNYTSVGSALTKTALDAAIKYINRTTPGAKAIVGTRAALDSIFGFAGFVTWDSTDFMVQSIQDEIMRTGKLGTYFGVPVIMLEQEYDNLSSYNKLLPEDKVLVIGQNVGEFITYGPVRSQEFTDMKPVPPYWTLSMYQKFGFMIWNANGIFVLGNIS